MSAVRNATCLIVACAVFLRVGALSAAEMPKSLVRCSELTRAAEQLPYERVYYDDPQPPSADDQAEVPPEAGTELPPGTSSDKSLSRFIARYRVDLEHAAADLESIESSNGEWGDDAAVLLGFLYLATWAQETWAKTDALDHYRDLARRTEPVRLDPRTVDQILKAPRSGHTWNERNESDSAKVARIFAVQLVLFTQVQAGRAAADKELEGLKSAPNLSPDVIPELTYMLTLGDELLKDAKAETPSPAAKGRARTPD